MKNNNELAKQDSVRARSTKVSEIADHIMSQTQDQWGHHLPKRKILDCIDQQLRGRKMMHKTDLRAVEDQIANAFGKIQNSSRGGSQYSISPRKQVVYQNTSPIRKSAIIDPLTHADRSSPRVAGSIELRLSQSDYKDAAPTATIWSSPNKKIASPSQTSFVQLTQRSNNGNTARSIDQYAAPLPNDACQTQKKRSIPTFKIKSQTVRQTVDQDSERAQMEASTKATSQKQTVGKTRPSNEKQERNTEKQIIKGKEMMIINNKFSKKGLAQSTKNEMNQTHSGIAGNRFRTHSSLNQWKDAPTKGKKMIHTSINTKHSLEAVAKKKPGQNNVISPLTGFGSLPAFNETFQNDQETKMVPQSSLKEEMTHDYNDSDLQTMSKTIFGSTRFKRQMERKTTVWDNILQAKHEEDLQLELLKRAQNKQLKIDLSKVHTSQMSMKTHYKNLELDHKAALHKEIENEFNNYQQDEIRKYEIRKKRQKDLSECYMGVVSAQQRSQERGDSHMVRKDRHLALSMKKQHEAERKLEKMRKERLRAELDIQLIKEKHKVERQQGETMRTERRLANTLYSTYHGNFDVNETRYHTRLESMVKKQDTIVNAALSPNQKFATHSIDRILRDEALDELLSTQVKNKQHQDTHKHQLMTQKRQNDYQNLQNSVNQQKLHKQNMQRNSQHTSLLDGQSIIDQDQQVSQIYRDHYANLKKVQQNSMRTALINQAFDRLQKEQKERIGELGDREYLLNRKPYYASQMTNYGRN